MFVFFNVLMVGNLWIIVFFLVIFWVFKVKIIVIIVGNFFGIVVIVNEIDVNNMLIYE